MKIFKAVIFALAISIFTILVFELFLRIAFGYPHGLFNNLLSIKDGLYPRNSTIIMNYGFKPYIVKSNSLGMRGEEVSQEKKKGTIRIMAIGDSVTDGYFVGNNETYPYLLEESLRAKGIPAEVLSGARGGCSIDKEYAILRTIIPLKPEIVLLTFVTNDISEILEKSKEELVSMKFRSALKHLPEWLLTETAIGEFIGDLKLKIRFRNYRLFDRKKNGNIQDADNYIKNAGRNYTENARIFRRTTKGSDSLLTNEPFSTMTNDAIANYIYTLKHLKEFCAANDAALIFIYFPNYAQIYDVTASLKIRDILAGECGAKKIPFLDLTEIFRQEGKNEVLHFAPLDFHCNPKGNKIIADAISGFLIANNLVNNKNIIKLK
ncbi:MAG: SGNH/GDSL hydrolase family protein [Candidatus Omnitrophota bacterium]